MADWDCLTGKGELFFVTDGGYRMAELMKTGEPSEGVARPLHYWLVRVRGDGEAKQNVDLRGIVQAAATEAGVELLDDRASA